MTENNEMAVMYLGPTIRGVARHGESFTGGLPARLKKLADAKPIVANLIVPLSEIVRVKQAVDTEGTPEAVYYDKIELLSEAEIKEITEGA